MSDYQQARAGLGAELRALRSAAGLTTRQLAGSLGWPQSKVSKLETGRQTPTAADLHVFAEATGAAERANELVARLRAFDRHYVGWRRQLAAGATPRARAAIDMDASVIETWACETALIPGLLQTADYARAILAAAMRLHGRGDPADIDAAVAARVKRQHLLHNQRHRLRVVLLEAALHTRLCSPEVMRTQLNRLAVVAALPTVDFGIVELGARLEVVPSHGFWVHHERHRSFVMVETIGAELRIEDGAEVATYRQVFESLAAVAVRGAAAQRLLTVRATREAL